MSNSPDLARLPGESMIMHQVRTFHHATGVPVAGGPASLAPSTIPRERFELRVSLIAEEFAELLDAMLGTEAGDAQRAAFETIMARWDGDQDSADVVAAADALADLNYVIAGTALEAAIPLDAVAREVHRSNMSKLGRDGRPILREDGKVLKGPDYFPPDVAGVLADDVVVGPLTVQQVHQAWDRAVQAAAGMGASSEYAAVQCMPRELGIEVDDDTIVAAYDAAFYANRRADQDPVVEMARRLGAQLAVGQAESVGAGA